MSMLDRFGRVVKAEFSHLVRRAPSREAEQEATHASASPARTGAPSQTGERHRERAVIDVAGALRVLELSGAPALLEVRARYRELARRYHPKTRSPIASEAQAALVVLDALTDALELLEEHLLPV